MSIYDGNLNLTDAKKEKKKEDAPFHFWSIVRTFFGPLFYLSACKSTFFWLKFKSLVYDIFLALSRTLVENSSRVGPCEGTPTLQLYLQLYKRIGE